MQWIIPHAATQYCGSLLGLCGCQLSEFKLAHEISDLTPPNVPKLRGEASAAAAVRCSAALGGTPSDNLGAPAHRLPAADSPERD